MGYSRDAEYRRLSSINSMLEGDQPTGQKRKESSGKLKVAQSAPKYFLLHVHWAVGFYKIGSSCGKERWDQRA